MTPRTRRWLTLVAIAVPALLLGRAAVDTLTSWWWAASVSSDAVASLTRWHLLRLSIFVVIGLVAILYWLGQYLVVARLADSSRRIATAASHTGPTVRTVAAVLAGVLTLITLLLHNTGEWASTIALRNAGLEYGIQDPLLGRDLGELVAAHPATELLHRFAIHLVVLGLLYATTIHLLIGGIRRTENRIETSPEARFVIGRLLMLLAILISLGYLLAPSRLAMSVDVPLDPGSADVRLVAMWLLAGIAFATALLAVPWIRDRRGNLLLAGWAVLAVAVATERLIVPAFVAEGPVDASHDAEQRRLEQAMYGIRLVDTTNSDTLPPVLDLWDESVLSRWTSARDERTVAVLPAGDATDPRWLVGSTTIGGESGLLVREVSSTALVLGDRNSPAVTMAHPGAVPGASGWGATRAGVRVGSWLRRLVLAWSLQAPGIFRLDSSATIDWLRDPQARMTRLLPPLEWRTTGLARIDGEVHWLVTGYASVREAPLVTRVVFDGTVVSGLVPALVGVVRASDGRTTVHRDPAGGPLGRAWARVFSEIVHDSVPPATFRVLPYPGEWFARQVAVMSLPHWGMGTGPDAGATVPTAFPVWLPTGNGQRVVLHDTDGRRPRTLLTASRTEGAASIKVERVPGGGIDPGIRSVAPWSAATELGRIADSVRATGDSLIPGVVRWHLGPRGFVSWQPFTVGGGTTRRLAWLGLAVGDHYGGARDPEIVLESILQAESGSAPEIVDWRSRFTELKSWLKQGDSALGRGDLTAFGRSWEALRRLILDSVPE